MNGSSNRARIDEIITNGMFVVDAVDWLTLLASRNIIALKNGQIIEIDSFAPWPEVFLRCSDNFLLNVALRFVHLPLQSLTLAGILSATSCLAVYILVRPDPTKESVAESIRLI